MVMRIITDNREARHNYFLEDFVIAGIVLEGSEVKALRQNKANLKDSYVIIRGNEMFLINCYIAPFEKTGVFVPDSRKTRKLLLKKQEIAKFESKINKQGFTIIPTKMFFEGNLVKVEIALAKGKKLYDKREDKKKNDLSRDVERQTKNV